jgi:hypothetical protein
MANIFYRKLSANVGTTATTVGSYTVGADTKSVVLGLTVANRVGSTISADVYINNGANVYYLVKGAPISAGGALVPIGGDQKLVLQAGDNVVVKSDSATSIDAIMSIMEIT